MISRKELRTITEFPRDFVDNSNRKKPDNICFFKVQLRKARGLWRPEDRGQTQSWLSCAFRPYLITVIHTTHARGRLYHWHAKIWNQAYESGNNRGFDFAVCSELRASLAHLKIMSVCLFSIVFIFIIRPPSIFNPFDLSKCLLVAGRSYRLNPNVT